ncbi:RNA-binding protein 47B [Actinidia rufa]|uniref:RNA-binding protein 47B n=1 Tax=Actinidia rufa TaxID=165716 RepID=A0A7J0FB67_9ERIC|nr:RNA-binding protein 47B [Actinidia rufa]
MQSNNGSDPQKSESTESRGGGGAAAVDGDAVSAGGDGNAASDDALSAAVYALPSPPIPQSISSSPTATPTQQHQQQQLGSNGENKTIWVGDLQNWMDEDYLHSCFGSTGEVASIKVIRNKQTGLSEGYGFVELFFPYLASDVTDSLLHETFASKYPSVKGAKVVIDVNTGCSKGYGFVRPMRIGAATPRKSSGYQQQYSSQGGYVSNGASAQGSQSDGDYTNTTIFVGGLGPNVKDEDLRQPFSQYGEIVSVKIPVRRGCGFVQFANRNNAEEALQKIEWYDNRRSNRCFWENQRADFGNSLNGAYYGGQIYDGYGYALPQPHDPSMYAAAAYGAYPVYGTHQQQLPWSVEFYDPYKCGVELNFDYTK